MPAVLAVSPSLCAIDDDRGPLSQEPERLNPNPTSPKHGSGRFRHFAEDPRTFAADDPAGRPGCGSWTGAATP